MLPPRFCSDLRSALRTGAVTALLCIGLQILEAAYGNAPGHFSRLLGLSPQSWAGRVADGFDVCYFVFMIVTDPTVIFPMGNPPPGLASALNFLRYHSPFIVLQYFFTGFFWWYTRHKSWFFVIPTIMSYFGAILAALILHALHFI